MKKNVYRGKRKDNSKWVYGSLFVGFQKSYICPVANAMYCFDGDLCLGGFIEVYPETVGQYTGLKDKNGKRIWEWDILHIAKIADGLGGYYQPPLDYPVNVVVKWDLCAWMWETLCDDKRYITFPDAWCHYECEIIGNIFDNPELLLESKEECNT